MHGIYRLGRGQGRQAQDQGCPHDVQANGDPECEILGGFILQTRGATSAHASLPDISDLRQVAWRGPHRGCHYLVYDIILLGLFTAPPRANMRHIANNTRPEEKMYPEMDAASALVSIHKCTYKCIFTGVLGTDQRRGISLLYNVLERPSSRQKIPFTKLPPDGPTWMIAPHTWRI